VKSNGGGVGSKENIKLSRQCFEIGRPDFRTLYHSHSP
jgi:hypothetical protein